MGYRELMIKGQTWPKVMLGFCFVFLTTGFIVYDLKRGGEGNSPHAGSACTFPCHTSCPVLPTRCAASPQAPKQWANYTPKSLKPGAGINLSFFFFPVCLFCHWDQVSLCSPGWPQTCDPPTSASWVLGLQASTTTPSFSSFSLSWVTRVFHHSDRKLSDTLIDIRPITYMRECSRSWQTHTAHFRKENTV
jgi:hypothetical protein